MPHGVARPARPQYSFHSPAKSVLIHFVSWAVVPEPSERTTGTMRRAGSDSPGLCAAISGSAHDVIFPVKIFVSTSPDGRRLVTRLVPIFRLYMNDVPPA